MRLLVLAGGFGTRLKTVVADVPKALAPIGHTPFLQLQIEHWLAQGLREFTFLLHHQAEQIITFLQQQKMGLLKDCQIDWLIEPMPMDTGGAVAHAVKELALKDDFLTAGYRELMQTATPALAVVHLSDVSRYGQVHFDINNHVTEFLEKTPQTASGWINAGLCHLHSDLFRDWNGQPFSMERELFASLVKNRSLTAVPFQSDFIDIGVPSDYSRFCRWVAEGRKTTLCN
jgi:NDP-sugar pyrophosphorylase family protein